MITAHEAKEISYNIKKDDILEDINENIKEAAYKGLTEYITDISSSSVIADDIVKILTDLGYVVFNMTKRSGDIVLGISWNMEGVYGANTKRNNF